MLLSAAYGRCIVTPPFTIMSPLAAAYTAASPTRTARSRSSSRTGEQHSGVCRKGKSLYNRHGLGAGCTGHSSLHSMVQRRREGKLLDTMYCGGERSRVARWYVPYQVEQRSAFTNGAHDTIPTAQTVVFHFQRESAHLCCDNERLVAGTGTLFSTYYARQRCHASTPR